MSRLYKKDDDVIVTNDSLQKTFKKINTTLDGLTVEVRESGGGLVLIVRGSEAFEGCTITAQCKLDNREYTKTLENGIAIIKVKLPGEYFIKNSHNDTMITCTIGEPFIDEVYFTDFYGSITCTVPELLIGETLEAKNGEHTVEKEIKSTVEVLDVYNQGTWSVGIKGTEFITPQEATLTEMGESKTVNLTLEGAAYITVTLADEIKTERITCKNGEEFTRTKTPIDGKVKFFVPTLANYTVCLEQSDLIKKEVNVEAQQEYQVTLDLNDLSVPVLLVTSKPEYEGYTIKVSRGDKTIEKELVNGAALYIIEENGEYSITSDQVPDRKRTVQIQENKLYKVRFGGYIFGIKVKKDEADPTLRVEPTEDLVGLRPISINQKTDVVDYGDMEGTFLFNAMNHVVLVDMTDGHEIELDPNDYTQRLEGGAAPPADITSNYNTFAKVDKVYTYMYDDEDYEYYYIAEERENDNYSAIGFMREDDSECDALYMATYEPSLDSQSRCRSVSGRNIRIYTSFGDFITASNKIGEGYYADQYQTEIFYTLALLILTQTFDVENKIGNGRSIARSVSASTKENSERTTGFGDKKGPVAKSDDLDDNMDKGIKFMHVEDLWRSVGGYWILGVFSKQNTAYVRMKPPYVTTSNGSVDTYIEVEGATHEEGWIASSVANNKFGRMASKLGASMSTYEKSTFQVKGNQAITLNAVEYRSPGEFGYHMRWDFQNSGTNSTNTRLTYLPPKKD